MSQLIRTPDSRAFMDLYRYVHNVAVPEAQKQLGQWLLINFTQNKRIPTLQALVDPQGEAQITLTLNKDATLAYTAFDPRQASHFTKGPASLIHPFNRHIARMLFTITSAEENCRATLFTTAHQYEETRRFSHFLYSTAYELAHRILAYSVTPSGSRQIGLNKANSTWQRLVKAHFTDQRTMAATSRISGRQHPTHHEYNFAQRNRELITSLNDAQLGAVRLFVHHIQDQDSAPHGLTWPEIQEIIGQRLKLTPDESRHLTCVTSHHPKNGAKHIAQATAATCRTLSQLAVEPDSPDAHHLAYMSNYHLLLEQTRRTNDWLTILRSYLASPKSQEDSYSVLQHIAQDLANTTPGQPWKHRPWRQYRHIYLKR